jgi:hypothetical protein
MLSFIDACRDGKLMFAKELFSKGGNAIEDCHNAFYYACGNGHLHVAKWLSIEPSIDIRAYGHLHQLLSSAFCWACSGGHLHVAKWLLNFDPSIDVRAIDDLAFRLACIYGHLHVAKWLLSIEPSIDVRAVDDYAFCLACTLGNLKVAKWLQRLVPMLKDEKLEAFTKKRVVQLIILLTNFLKIRII